MPARVLISAAFESPDLRASGVAGWQCAPNGSPCVGCPDTGYAIRVVPAQEPSGLGGVSALQLDRRPGDDPMLGGVAYGPRAQVQFTGRPEEHAGSGILGLRLAVRVMQSPPAGAWNVFGWQWHAKADGSPSLGFYRVGDRLELHANRWGSGGVIEYARVLWSAPIRFGQLMVIDVRLNASNSDADGWVEVVLDGQPQLMANGQGRYQVRTTPPAGIGCYSILSNYSHRTVAASVLQVAFFGLAHGDWFPGQAGLPTPAPPVDATGPLVEILTPAAEAAAAGAVPVRARVVDTAGVDAVAAGLNIPDTAVSLTRVAGTDEWVGTVQAPAGTAGRFWVWVTATDRVGNDTDQALPVNLTTPAPPPPDDPVPEPMDVAAVLTALHDARAALNRAEELLS